MGVGQGHGMLKACESEAKLNTLDPFELRLIRRYTWRQQAKKGKNPKKYGANAPQLHHIWPQTAPGAMRQLLSHLSIFDGDGARVRGPRQLPQPLQIPVSPVSYRPASINAAIHSPIHSRPSST